MAAALLVFLLVLASNSAAEAADDASKIPVSFTLSSNTNESVWLSPSGIFAFGFYATLAGNAVCIFMTGISEKTVVWTANEVDPMLPNNANTIVLQDNGVAVWQERGGRTYIYDRIATVDDSSIESASMLDNGNFVLYDLDGRVVWQSFDHPTVALLSGQRLPVGEELVSRSSETDLARGLFRIKMQSDGNLVQYPLNTPDTMENAYYSSNTYEARTDNVSLYVEEDGRLYLSNGISFSHNLTVGGGYAEGIIYLARVDPDGIFRVYSRSLIDGGGNWTAVWRSSEDKCDPKGICGANSFCSYENEIVNCTCLPGFRDSGSGCKEDFVAGDCKDKKKPTVRYEITRIVNVTWEDNYYDESDATNEEDCRGDCLGDCDCGAALFKDGKCRKQRFPLMYGRRWTSDDSNIALVRVTLPSPAASPLGAPAGSGSESGKGLHEKRVSSLKKIMIIGVSIGIFILLISSIFVYYIAKRCGLWGQDEESKQNVNKFLLSHGSLAPKRYSYKEIKKMTKCFAEKLGQGGYGVVYKGKLPDGQLVAVKVLIETHDNAEEFVNEVASISRTSHVNIVNLLGFCFERKKRALVYEFMPNKSLDKFIYKKGSLEQAECSLEWKKLFEIAVGVARGLEYLHRGCNTPIVHFDIKPQNILLDDDFCPKISDFGLAKLCMKKQSVISMLGTRGTIGYIAPEVFSRNFGLVSHKSDVYSYGIMLLQMAEARTNVEIKSIQSSENYFLEKIHEQVVVKNEKIYGEMTEEEEEAVRKMVVVGFWCIQTAPADRPSMNNVVEMLGGNLECIKIPPLPFLLSSPKPELSCLLRVTVETKSSSKS